MSSSPTPVAGRPLPQHQWPWFRIVATVAVAVVAVLVVVDLVDRGSSNSPGDHGSGVAATESRSVSPFTRLELAGANNVDVHVGGKQSVVVHADDNLLKHVRTVVRGGALAVETPGTFSTVAPMSVEITVPSLAAISLSGSGNITVAGVSAPSLVVRLPGSGNIQVLGTAGRLDASLSGSGNEQLMGLRAHDARAVVSGSGNIFTTVTGSLDAVVSGSGTIVHSGGATVTQRVTGSGAVVPG